MKFFSTSIVALSGLLAPGTFALPAARDNTCSPNFMGRAVSILAPSKTKEWGPGKLFSMHELSYQSHSSDMAEYKIPFTGDASGTYYLKSNDAPANNFYAGQGPRTNSVVWYESTDGSGSRWTINCSWCSSSDAWSTHGTYASGCTIALNGLCAREYPDSDLSDYPRLYSCDGSANQSWDFVLA